MCDVPGDWQDSCSAILLAFWPPCGLSHLFHLIPFLTCPHSWNPFTSESRGQQENPRTLNPFPRYSVERHTLTEIWHSPKHIFSPATLNLFIFTVIIIVTLLAFLPYSVNKTAPQNLSWRWEKCPLYILLLLDYFSPSLLGKKKSPDYTIHYSLIKSISNSFTPLIC